MPPQKLPGRIVVNIPKPPPLNADERKYIAEAVAAFWGITQETYHLNTPSFLRPSSAETNAWRTHFEAEFTTVLTAFLNRVCDQGHGDN